jgi:hypothetical protein
MNDSPPWTQKTENTRSATCDHAWSVPTKARARAINCTGTSCPKSPGNPNYRVGAALDMSACLVGRQVVYVHARKRRHYALLSDLHPSSGGLSIGCSSSHGGIHGGAALGFEAGPPG